MYLLFIDTIGHITYIQTHTYALSLFFFETRSLCLVMLEKKIKEIRSNYLIFQEIRALATLADRVTRIVKS